MKDATQPARLPKLAIFILVLCVMALLLFVATRQSPLSNIPADGSSSSSSDRCKSDGDMTRRSDSNRNRSVLVAYHTGALWERDYITTGLLSSSTKNNVSVVDFSLRPPEGYKWFGISDAEKIFKPFRQSISQERRRAQRFSMFCDEDKKMSALRRLAWLNDTVQLEDADDERDGDATTTTTTKMFPIRVLVAQTRKGTFPPDILRKLARYIKPHICISTSDENGAGKPQLEALLASCEYVFKQYYHHVPPRAPLRQQSTAKPKLFLIPLGWVGAAFPLDFGDTVIESSFNLLPHDGSRNKNYVHSHKAENNIDSILSQLRHWQRAYDREGSEARLDQMPRLRFTFEKGPVPLASRRVWDWALVAALKSDRRVMLNVFTQQWKSSSYFLKSPLYPLITLPPYSASSKRASDVGNNTGDDRRRRRMVAQTTVVLPTDERLDTRSVTAIYRNAAWAPIGFGFESFDCFRIYECSRVGTIPIIAGDVQKIRETFAPMLLPQEQMERLVRHHGSNSASGNFGEVAAAELGWLVADSWEAAAAMAQNISDNHPQVLDEMQRKTVATWNGMMAAARGKIAEITREVIDFVGER